MILKFGNLNAQHHNILYVYGVHWYMCVKFKSVIFFISCMAFQMLHTRNVENWDTAVYVVSMCMHCYHRVDINLPCFIICRVLADL